MSIHHSAVVAMLFAASAASASEPVRIEPVVYPMLQPGTAKQGGEASGKPAPMPRVPGPVITAHAHRNADGSLEIDCTVEHQAPKAAGTDAEAGR